MNNKCIANDENIVISFKYSLNDKNHLIDKITNQKGKCNKIIKELFKKLKEISNLTWKELTNMPKEVGYEMIPISEFKINFEGLKKDLNLSDDSKIIVFRFNNQKCRLLGVRFQENSSILYIIGYDWDYTAYKH